MALLQGALRWVEAVVLVEQLPAQPLPVLVVCAPVPAVPLLAVLLLFAQGSPLLPVGQLQVLVLPWGPLLPAAVELLALVALLAAGERLVGPALGGRRLAAELAG